MLLRPSGTEPLVRVMAEAPSAEEAEAVCERLVALVRDELGLSRLRALYPYSPSCAESSDTWAAAPARSSCSRGWKSSNTAAMTRPASR